MRWIARIIVVILLGFVVYLFWPRTASLSDFKPEEMAEIELTIWEKQLTQQFFRRTMAYYGLFFGQYHLSPFTAIYASGQFAWTSAKCKNLKIEAEFEKLRPTVKETYLGLADKLGIDIDAEALARYQVEIWRQAFTPGEYIQTDPYVGFLNELYGISPREAEPIAVAMAEARAIFCENEDDLNPEVQQEVKELLTQAYTQLQALIQKSDAEE